MREVGGALALDQVLWAGCGRPYDVEAMMHRKLSLLGLMLILGLSWPSASQAANTALFSRAAILENYRNGDFDQVVDGLKPILSPGHRVSRSDSLFALRLLGVVWVADPKTREKGRYCWIQLLDLDAKSDLVDLFVGEEVDRFWERTRMEHRVRQRTARLQGNDTDWITSDEAEALQKLLDVESIGAQSEDSMGLVLSANQAKADGSSIRQPFGNVAEADTRSFWKRPGTWIAGAVTAGVVGFTMYYTLGDPPAPREKLYHVSKETASLP